MKVITTYIEGGRTYKICKDSHGYWGFETKYIENNRLTKQFNGASGFLSKTVEEVIKKISNSIKIDNLVENGMDRMEAVYKVMMGL